MSNLDDGISKFDLRSEDILGARRQQVLHLFPEAHTESGEINFDVLRLSLGEAANPFSETFGMSWPGKAECEKLIQKQSTLILQLTLNYLLSYGSKLQRNQILILLLLFTLENYQ